jgi:hypothetical protein
MPEESNITAIYRGVDGDLDYRIGPIYHLILTTVGREVYIKATGVVNVNPRRIPPKIPLPCRYGSIHKFFDNWHSIKKV